MKQKMYMAKNRHIKTLIERFGINPNIESKDQLIELTKPLLISIREYSEYCDKKRILFNLENYFKEKNIFEKGIFYLEALGSYNKEDKYLRGVLKDGKWTGYVDRCDAYDFQNDDEFCQRVSLTSDYEEGDKEYMEYIKYYVMDSSINGWSLVLFNYPKLPYFDYKYIKNEILLEGNIGQFID